MNALTLPEPIAAYFAAEQPLCNDFWAVLDGECRRV